jgi:RNA polymerase sigma factor (sigma-70 family)
MTIPIDNNLITTWEPKIQGLVNKYYVTGMDKDDLIQELRMVLMRCAEKYDTTKSTASFHTYVHRGMINTLITLINKATKLPEVVSFDKTFVSVTDNEQNPNELQKALEDPNAEDFSNLLLLDDILSDNNETFTDKEKVFISSRVDGLTMEEITEDLGESSYRVRQNLKERLKAYINGIKAS